VSTLEEQMAELARACRDFERAAAKALGPEAARLTAALVRFADETKPSWWRHPIRRFRIWRIWRRSAP